MHYARLQAGEGNIYRMRCAPGSPRGRGSCDANALWCCCNFAMNEAVQSVQNSFNPRSLCCTNSYLPVSTTYFQFCLDMSSLRRALPYWQLGWDWAEMPSVLPSFGQAQSTATSTPRATGRPAGCQRLALTWCFRTTSLVSRFLVTNDFSPNRAFSSITFQGSNYFVRGNAILLTNGMLSVNPAGANHIDTDVC